MTSCKLKENALFDAFENSQKICAGLGIYFTQRETHEAYPTISIAEILKLARKPQKYAKENAPWAIFSLYHAHDARSHSVQREKGQFYALAADIDKGNHSLDDIVIGLQRGNTEVSALVYSTSSSRAENRRWRIILPFVNSIPGSDYEIYQTAFFNNLAKYNIEADRALSRAGQPVMLPNVPPENRNKYGFPSFYQFAVIRHGDRNE